MPAKLKMASKRTPKCRGKRSWFALLLLKGSPVHPASRPGLLGFSLLGDFFQFLLQVLLIFLLQLGVAWAGIYFAGLVFSLGELLLRPFVVDMNFVGLIEHRFYELRRNEVHAFSVTDDEVAGHYRGVANPYWDIYSRQHHVANGRRIGVTVIGRHLDFRNSVLIADATVYNQSRCVCSLGKIIEEVVNNNC